MKDTKDLPKDLPSMEQDIILDVVGNLTGKTFKGEFKFRMPNLKGRATIDKKRAELNGNIEARFLDPTVALFHSWIAYLRGTLIEFPKWWKDCDYGYDLHDSNVIENLYEQCDKFEKNWLIKVWGEPEETPKEEKPSEAEGA